MCNDKPRTGPGLGITLALLGIAGLVVFAVTGILWGILHTQVLLVIGGIILTTLSLTSVKIAAQWEKMIILRLGRFHRVAGPGPVLIVPLVDTVAACIDQRIITTSFTAEQTLTKDTVPVDVDAVLFWVVWDPEKAALEVNNYKEAVSWAAQTALREVIGRTQLSDILAAREEIDEELRKIIDHRTEPWGIAVQAVEIRDVIIPSALQEAMSREAQAERERRARIILGTAETEIAVKFAEAARAYEDNPVALQLRAMNVLYEGLKERGALVVVPSGTANSMDLGAILGTSAISETLQKGAAGGKKE
ncbi:peptidase [Clostridiales bacterium PH28_bin88]|nr:peptidase [Clostridiales bacterium PH28_bin88]